MVGLEQRVTERLTMNNNNDDNNSINEQMMFIKLFLCVLF